MIFDFAFTSDGQVIAIFLSPADFGPGVDKDHPAWNNPNHPWRINTPQEQQDAAQERLYLFTVIKDIDFPLIGDTREVNKKLFILNENDKVIEVV